MRSFSGKAAGMADQIAADTPTGQQLVDSIHELAAATGKTPVEIARHLSAYPHNWLRQLAAAAAPRPETIERVNALLAGAGLSRAPRITRRIVGHRGAAAGTHSRPPIVRRAVRPPDPADPRPPAFSRDPCVRCGARGDLGCAHQQPFIEEAMPPAIMQEGKHHGR